MNTIILYTRPGCHLCEDGQWMLEVALRDHQLPVQLIDISGRADLIDRYGIRIPVLSHAQLAHELDWPFTPEDILAWLGPLLATG